MKKLFLCIAMLFAYIHPSFSQRVTGNDDGDDGDDPYDTKSYFMFGFNYLSNNVYLGRKDTSVIPYYSPYIGYHFKNGLYAKAMTSFTTTGGTHLDLTTFEAGYDHNFGEHFNGGLNLDKFYYNKNSLSVRAGTKGSAGINGQYNNNWLEPQVTFDLDFNKKSTDYVLGLLLDHDFSLASHTLDIIPTAGVNYGTRHFYDDYFINRFKKNDKTVLANTAVADASRFVPLDYELSTKVTFRVTKWLFTLTPTYAIPLSPATITIPATKKKPEQVIQEKLTNSFYVELDICHR